MSRSDLRATRPNPLRATFLPAREVLERTQEHLCATRERVRRAPRPDSRADLLCTRLDSLLAELSDGIARVLREVDDEGGDVWSQYTLALGRLSGPPPAAAAPETADPEQLIPWALLECVESVLRVLRELAESVPHDELGERFQGLADLVQRSQQRIARLDHEFRDL
jgi:hypothetical protein